MGLFRAWVYRFRDWGCSCSRIALRSPDRVPTEPPFDKKGGAIVDMEELDMKPGVLETALTYLSLPPYRMVRVLPPGRGRASVGT